jgi:hypothetical protein
MFRSPQYCVLMCIHMCLIHDDGLLRFMCICICALVAGNHQVQFTVLPD